MGERLHLPISMWRVQLQLLGGSRKLSMIVVICAILLIFGTVAIRKLYASDPLASVAGGILNFLTAIQLFIVLLGGCNAVYRSMLRDYDTKMIESHRLTPMSSVAVTLGYLFGSTMQVGALFVLFGAFGVLLTIIAGLPVLDWILGNLVLLCGAIAVWAALTFAGMRQEKPSNPAPVILVVAALCVPIAFVPGIALLFNVYTILTAVLLMTSTGGTTTVVVTIPAILSLLFAVFWVFAAAVKYRRPDLPALNGVRGLVLLVLSMLIGTAGILAFEKVARAGAVGLIEPGMERTQWVATMIGGIVLASLVVCASVRSRTLISRGTAPRGWSDRVSDLAVAIMAVFLVCGIMAAVGAAVWRNLLPEADATRSNLHIIAWAWGCSSAACLLAVLTVRSLFELVQVRAKSASVIVALFIIVAWAVPPMADFIFAEMANRPGVVVEYSWFTGCSPMGTIIGVWTMPELLLWPGLLAQSALLCILVMLARRVRRQRAAAIT